MSAARLENENEGESQKKNIYIKGQGNDRLNSNSKKECKKRSVKDSQSTDRTK